MTNFNNKFTSNSKKLSIIYAINILKLKNQKLTKDLKK